MSVLLFPTPWYALPTSVIAAPGGFFTFPLHSETILVYSTFQVTLRNWAGLPYSYVDPAERT